MSLVDALPEAERRLARRNAPRFIPLMLATLTEERFSNQAWLYELKFDGERVEAVADDGDIRLISRNEQRLEATYPELVDALSRQPVERFVIDGEVVALDAHGVPNFARLQRRMHQRNPSPALQQAVPVTYFIFDLMHLDGFDLMELPLRRRKALLRRAFSFRKPLRFSTHRIALGEELLAQACRRGFEGVIAKRADSRYVNRRSTDWLKFKCIRSQEMVIGGYTDPQGSRTGLGALLVGYHDGSDLVYAGKVGTGFDTTMLTTLHQRLRALERETSPFDHGKVPTRGVHWVRPQLVCEVAFTEWTADGRLRHPRFKGLRRDKDPRAVVRERPAA